MLEYEYALARTYSVCRVWACTVAAVLWPRALEVAFVRQLLKQSCLKQSSSHPCGAFMSQTGQERAWDVSGRWRKCRRGHPPYEGRYSDSSKSGGGGAEGPATMPSSERDGIHRQTPRWQATQAALVSSPCMVISVQPSQSLARTSHGAHKWLWFWHAN